MLQKIKGWIDLLGKMTIHAVNINKQGHPTPIEDTFNKSLSDIV